ncbi:MAG: hypothetical protein CMI09_09240 [Oceanospirillaceae bacterium]|nr:hypothetical protein [Oceanospirillaceae bacterium]|tara:strand:- start:478 stop:1089 length:612 start_codon:yes stop_codon:yes gene_type:complete
MGKAEREAARKLCEAKYRLGTFTNVELAAEFGVTETTVRNWAKKGGWKKDLTQSVQKLTRRKIAEATKDAIKPDPDTGEVDDEKVVEAVASEASQVVLNHRALGGRFETAIDNLLTRLEEQVAKERITVQIQDATVEVDVPLEYVGKVVNAATQSFERVVKIQRLSYGLDEKEEQKMPGEDLTDSELDRRIERLAGAVDAKDD